MRNGVAAVAAAVDDLFQQIVQVANHHRLQRLELAAVDFAQQVEHHIVGFAFDALQAVVHRLDGFQRRHFPQQPDHLRKRFGRPLHELHLPREVDDSQTLRGKIETLREFFDHLANAVHRIRERLDVFPLQARDERVDQLLADLFGDVLVFAASQGKFMQRMRMAAVFQQLDQQPGQGLGFVGAGFQQIEKLRIVAEVLLDRKTWALAW